MNFNIGGPSYLQYSISSSDSDSESDDGLQFLNDLEGFDTEAGVIIRMIDNKYRLLAHCLAQQNNQQQNNQVTHGGSTMSLHTVHQPFPCSSMEADNQQPSQSQKQRQTLQMPRKRNQNLSAPPSEDMEDLFTQAQTKTIRTSLLEWYGLNRRDLPWRLGEEDIEKRAYRVWVSEVMLQQTRVQTVIDYFDRWMRKWPTIHHLSMASLEEVNEMWAGLGYYRRARFLLEGAKTIVAEGQFPKTVSSLKKVPGIGDYTAGAIASIAFNEVVPVVDGNVIRVIARVRAIAANPKDSVTVKKFWELAAQLVDPVQPGDFNQALMELGATVCTPLSPSCSSCPVSDHCQALSISKRDSSVLVTDYPVKGVKLKQRHDFSAVCVLEILKDEEILEGNVSESEFLLVKRPDEGLLAGLWEFPSVLVDGEVDLVTRREAIDQFLENNFRLGLKKKIVLREHVGEFVHIFSHIRLKIYVELFVLHLKGGMKGVSCKQDKEAMPWKCVDSKVLSSMGLTSSVRKVYTMVQKFKQQKQNSTSNPNPTRKRNRTTRTS